MQIYIARLKQRYRKLFIGPKQFCEEPWEFYSSTVHLIISTLTPASEQGRV